MPSKEVDRLLEELVSLVSSKSLRIQVSLLNKIRRRLHEISPFKEEPVDFVEWVMSERVEANDYNPNAVAPPEMKLLEHSIECDGYTQPIVSWKLEDKREVVDGFHRNLVGKKSDIVKERIKGYLPIVSIKSEQTSRNNRIASTIRHNRARGKHKVESMSDIVIELKKRNWSDSRIAKELGMDQDEVLRLCQITGLTDVFDNQEFSKAWEVNKEDNLESFEAFEKWIADREENGVDDVEEESERIFHEYTEWECYKANFYGDHPPEGMTEEDCEQTYAEILRNPRKFSSILKKVIDEWPCSCEHYLTNDRMNRIAWLGQASLAYEYGIPSRFRGGYNLLSDDEKLKADQTALKWLNQWRKDRGELPLDLEGAGIKAMVNLY